MTTFSYAMADRLGVIPDPELTGQTITHANGKDYTVTGFVWLGADDMWGFKHIGPEGVECVRPISHILGNRDDGRPRYFISDRTEAIASKMLQRS